MDCFSDFCLGCDRESSSGPYCSQECRMADLEKSSTAASSSSPTTPSPSHHHHHHHLSWPLIDDSTGDRYTTRSPRNASGEPPHPQASYFMATPTTTDLPPERSLSPSSSRSSLTSSSNASSSGTSSANRRSGLSEQSLAMLEAYFASFDKTRTAKRRQSMW